MAERQIIEIAKAFFADAQVIILDEATAPLPKNEVEMLFDFVAGSGSGAWPSSTSRIISKRSSSSAIT